MFCPRPFTEVYIDDFGDCHLCCPFWTDMTVGNVLKTSLLQIWNGDLATRLRESILDQSFSHCGNCGNRSVIQDKEPTYDLSVIKVLTLSYDQTCNLKCPSCRIEAKGPSPFSRQIHNAIISSGILKHVLCLRAFGGGDALASPLFRETLCQLPVIDHHPSMTLSLQTNGLLLTPERYDEVLLSGCPVSEVLVSVDAANATTYRQVRGGNWDLLMDNIARLHGRGCRTQMNFVVQDLNFREMGDFIALARVLKVNSVYFSVLENWGTYTTAEYLLRSIHRPTHPRHGELVEQLRSLDLKPRSGFWVSLTNLTKLL